jgi:hypothetical protein
MSESLDAACTPLKKGYDSCMNKWLEEYLQTVADHKTKPNSAAVKAKGQELQTRCGSVFARYRSCVQVRRSWPQSPAVKRLPEGAGRPGRLSAAARSTRRRSTLRSSPF